MRDKGHGVHTSRVQPAGVKQNPSEVALPLCLATRCGTLRLKISTHLASGMFAEFIQQPFSLIGRGLGNRDADGSPEASLRTHISAKDRSIQQNTKRNRRPHLHKVSLHSSSSSSLRPAIQRSRPFHAPKRVRQPSIRSCRPTPKSTAIRIISHRMRPLPKVARGEADCTTRKYREAMAEHGHKNPDGMPAIPVCSTVWSLRHMANQQRTEVERGKPSRNDGRGKC